MIIRYDDSLRMAMMGQRGCLFHMFPVSSFLVEGRSQGQTRNLLEHLTAINDHVWRRLFELQQEESPGAAAGAAGAAGDAGAAGAGAGGGAGGRSNSIQ